MSDKREYSWGEIMHAAMAAGCATGYRSTVNRSDLIGKIDAILDVLPDDKREAALDAIDRHRNLGAKAKLQTGETE